MKQRNTLTKRIVSAVLCLTLLMAYFPFAAIQASAASAPHYGRAVDANTMNNWTKYFDLTPGKLTTANAGGVWTDKSVFTDASAFSGKVSMLSQDRNFLTALSALAANKEVVGYSTVPTDTVLVLDLSNSIPITSRPLLVQAANNAIAELNEVNNNNRVGVVLYSGSSSDRGYDNAVTRLMPIDRYTPGVGGAYLTYNNGNVAVARGVQGTKNPSGFASKSFGGATYIQAGLWEAWKMFDEVPENEIQIQAPNWQAGEKRMPIMVLMSDGAPTLGATRFDDVENSTYRSGFRTYNGADVGNGADSNLPDGQGFLVQLTASYIKNRLENKYQVHTTSGAGRSLFYTLGFNIDSISGNARNVAMSVLNPDSSTITDHLWASYQNTATDTVQVNVKGRDGDHTNVTVTKNSYATDKSYVDEYFSASGDDGLTAAFTKLVEEIILQSRYYPTHLEGGSPDFSGYLEFTDELGEYMEVKHVAGILLGDTLFDGHMMASKLADTTAGGLGTPDNPTLLGDEFIGSVKTRLDITSTAEAQALVKKAYQDGQLRYNSDTDWSNYIAWYADADNRYLGFYDEDGTELVPASAVYLNRSYGFLGETHGSIKNSDMMYMSVQVQTNLETEKQTVNWRIPAALVPMITYLVTLQGVTVDQATDVQISVENADQVAPIRLIYETGLRSDLNEFNITQITGKSINDPKINDERHLAGDAHTRLFWNNSYDITSSSHDQHKTALAEFIPNLENERFYYTFDSAVYKKTGDTYTRLARDEVSGTQLDANGDYYHRRYVFTQEAADKKPVFFYEKMSSASIQAAQWRDNFETLDHVQVGAWVVPKGTPARELDMYDESKAQNLSSSAHMVFHPYMTEHNNLVYVDMNLGNNGLLSVSPATGIKISKEVDVFEPGTSDSFRFRITTSASGTFRAYLTATGQTPQDEGFEARFVGGVYEFDLKKDQTLWLSDLPAGTTYTVEEISDNSDYKVKSVHVNGVSTGKIGTGTVSQYLMDDVLFVNTAIGERDLVVTKQVLDPTGKSVDINSNIKFTAEITLTKNGNPLTGTVATSQGDVALVDGKMTVRLAAGESFLIREVQEETRFDVVEIPGSIPQGFALDSARSTLSGVVDEDEANQAIIVNTYTPTPVNGQSVSARVEKVITGRSGWLDGESYTFRLERLDPARATATPVASVTIDKNDVDKAHLFSLAGETWSAPGTYYYKLYEEAGSQGGITYDTAERLFSVQVADSDKNGTLEVISVYGEVNTTVTGTWVANATFTNVYAPTGSAQVLIPIQKTMVGDRALSGYQFALYSADPSVGEADEVIRSGLTDHAGKTGITLNFTAADVGQTFTYYLAEIGRGERIGNIDYSTAVFPVEVSVLDNLDGSIRANVAVHGLPTGVTTPTFTNTYNPAKSDFVTISGSKTITDNRILNAGEFEFILTPVTSGAPMPTTDRVKNEAGGSFAFPPITFGENEKGQTFLYKVTENRSSPIGGFTYDTGEYTVRVFVRENHDANNTLTAVVTMEKGGVAVEDITFHNTYAPQPIQVTIPGSKILTGKNLGADEFSFRLDRVTPASPLPANTLVKNDAKGAFAFGPITFSAAGRYVYTVSEVAGTDPRFDYDRARYQVIVTVRDNSEGLLTSSISLTRDGMDSGEIVFRNTFTPAPISYDLHLPFPAEKALNGRPLAEGEFKFSLIDAITGKQVGESVANAADGTFRFPAVTLATPGIHHYKIVEVVGDEKGVTYDTSSFHIRLEVTMNGNTGILSVTDSKLFHGTITKEDVGGTLTEVTRYDDVTSTGKIEFHNKYSADPAYVILEATKTLTGRDLADGEFKFDLHKTGSDFAVSGSTVDQNDVVLTLGGDGKGKVRFMPLSFDAEGTYYFVILEDEVKEKGVTPDPTRYEVKITVTDNHKGDLEAQVEVDGTLITGSTAGTVVFRNTYKAEASQILIQGKKTLEGRDLTEGEFSFELYDKDSKLVEKVTNGKDGAFSFAPIPVDTAGEYRYVVRETQGQAEGVTYDTSVYTVIATVVDNLDGTFAITYRYEKESVAAEFVGFTNVYTAPTPAPAPQPPQTGDASNLFLWFALLFVSGTTLFGTALTVTKKKERAK